VNWRRQAAALATACLVQLPGACAVSAADRGEYLAAAAGCVSCHTEEGDNAAPFAGGRALVTPFGTFYAPNITPDPETGIGSWSDEDFLRALQEGAAPGGEDYFPAFPFTAYSGMTRADALAIRRYLATLTPVRRANRPHELPWYLRSRLAASAWKWLAFSPRPFAPDGGRSAEWNRGAYLVRHLGHCGQCHTPRNGFGALRDEAEMAGNPEGPEGRRVPNITPDEQDGIGEWSASDLETFLEIGMLPDGDFAGAGMGEVIDANTSRLSAADRSAIAAYLRSLPPLPDTPRQQPGDR